MDEVFIRDLHARGIIGVYAFERDAPQDILINVTLFADLRPAGLSDDLAASPDYGRLAGLLKAHAESAARRTVEALAEDLAGICLREPGVQHVRVSVEKPQAVPAARSVGVTIERP